MSLSHLVSHCKHSWKIFVTATACVIILLYSYRRILKHLCCALRVTFSRNQNERRLLNKASPDFHSLQFPSRGLESSIMHSLLITQFKKKSEKEEEHTERDTDCAVCLGEFEEGEWIKRLPNCTHTFHVSCVDTWFQSHSNCPLCRSQVFDLTIHHEYSISVSRSLETLTREDFSRERAAHSTNPELFSDDA